MLLEKRRKRRWRACHAVRIDPLTPGACAGTPSLLRRKKHPVFESVQMERVSSGRHQRHFQTRGGEGRRLRHGSTHPPFIGTACRRRRSTSTHICRRQCPHRVVMPRRKLNSSIRSSRPLTIQLPAIQEIMLIFFVSRRKFDD